MSALPRFPKAILFDLDGVIVDSEPRHIDAFEQLFHELLDGRPHGLDLPSYIGRSDLAVWTDFIERHRPVQALDHLTRTKQDCYLEILRRERPRFSPIPALVADLAQQFPLAVASGSVHRIIEEVLALDGLRRHFRTIASVEDVGVPKPAPDVFLLAARRLGVAPGDCCVIEDSAAGVTAGRSAGMSVIAITHSLPRERLSHAHVIVDHLDEIRPLLGIPSASSSRD